MTTHRMDAELQDFVSQVATLDLSDVAAARKTYADAGAARPAPDVPGLRIEDVLVPATPNAPDVRDAPNAPDVPDVPGVPVRVYRPREARGAIVWLHGGGFVMGDLETERPWATRIAVASGAVVISVDYRRAPEHRFPAALDDAYAVLTWAAEHASELGVDPARIAVGGHSAGAGLAAQLTLRARDRQGPPICFQLLNEAELDDRQTTWSQQNFTDTPWVSRDVVAASWQHYLGTQEPTQYAAPGRASDLTGLPAAYIATAEFDPNRDEGILYGLRLLQAGVPVELRQWPGTFHGSQAILSADVSRRQLAELTAALRRALL